MIGSAWILLRPGLVGAAGGCRRLQETAAAGQSILQPAPPSRPLQWSGYLPDWNIIPVIIISLPA